jgi:signal transduction histidine kinase
LLLKNTHADALEDKMFDIVNHLNLGRTLLQKKEEQEELVQLNLLASKKAKHSNAFGPALNYVLIGTELLIEDDWEIQYNLIYELFLERAICEHMVGNLEAAEELLRIVLKKARNKLDRAKVQTEMELLYLSQGRHQDVIDTILNTLEELGFEVPEQSNPDDILMTSKILRKKAFDMIGNRSIEELLYCSETTVPIAIEAHKHLYNLAPSSFFLNMNLYLWLGAQNLELAVRTGNTELASFNYSVCGLSLLVQGELNLAYKFAKLGVELSNKYQSNRMKGACYFHFCLINSWKNHFKSDVRYACLGYQFALDAGDYFFMTWSAYTHVRGLTLMGSPLKNIVEQVNRYVGLVKKINYENAAFLIASQRMALALMGKTRSNDSYDDDEFDESTFVQEVSAYENPALIFNYYIYKLQSLYILDKSAKAYVLLPKAEKFLSPQWVEITEYYFYYSLILADIYPRLDTDAQVKTMNILYENRQKMQDWATAGSENFQNRYLLVEAEIARISNENWQATTFYDRAILSARENEFIQNEAIANELAAKFWLGKEEIAQIYLRKAHYAYQQWGATAKVKALEARYPQLLTAPKILSSDVTITDTLMSTDVTRMQTSKALDLDSVTKAAQTLTSEIVLDKLLEKMMYIVIENAGAERGFLLLPQGEQWVIEAEGAIDKPKITTLHSLPAANYLPEAIFNYVARTHENVVLANARREGHYTEEPYIKTHQTQSVLCFPIIYQQQLRAILYFENNLTTAAFTPQRLKVLTMLSSQIAISLENAQVMANLDTKVKERTAQLNAKVEELTQTRHELVQSEKMASLGRLVAGFAHELNTPLGVAIGSASMLQRKAKKVNSLVEQEEVDVDELLAILKSIDKGSDLTLSNLERAANLVTSFKRTAIDQTSDKARSFHVHQVVNDTINTLQSQFKKTDIEISVDCPKALKVKSLPGALEQILTNLLMNSLIHGFNEGQNAGVIQINVQLSGEQLHLEYSDNGKGIASENLEKIFEPFFTTYRAHGGSGLGMYICYNVVTTQLHGTINCESTLGKGVIFRIDYPI